MRQAKQASKKKRVSKVAVPAFGAAGLTFSLAGGASASAVPTADVPQRRISHLARRSRSAKKKSPTSAWPPSISSTRKTPLIGVQLAWRGCGGCRGCGRLPGAPDAEVRGCRCGVGCRADAAGCGGCGVGFVDMRAVGVVMRGLLCIVGPLPRVLGPRRILIVYRIPRFHWPGSRSTRPISCFRYVRLHRGRLAGDSEFVSILSEYASARTPAHESGGTIYSPAPTIWSDGNRIRVLTR